MPRNSAGTYTVPNVFLPNTVISSSQVNANFSDSGNALTDSLDRTGRGGMLANLDFGTFRGINCADPANPQDVSTRAFSSNASNLASGTIPDGRLSGNVAVKNQDNNFSVGQSITGALAVTGAITATSTITAALFSGSGASLTNIPDGALSSNVALKNAANVFTGGNKQSVTDGTSTIFINNAAGVGYFGTETNHPLYIRTNDANRIQVAAPGNVTINAPGSGATLALDTVSVDGIVVSRAATQRGWLGGDSGGFGVFGAAAQAGGGVYVTPTKVQFFGTAGNIRGAIENGMILGNPTGGDKGAGTFNTAGIIYQNNVPVVPPLRSIGAAMDISTIQVGQSAYVYKTSNTARTNNAIAALDPVLQFTNAPAGTYLTEGVLKWNQASNTADFRIGWPRGVDYTGTIYVLGVDNAATQTEAAIPFLSAETEIDNASAGSSTQGATITGTQVATAGQTLGPTWAQWSANANATTVVADSWLKVTRLS